MLRRYLVPRTGDNKYYPHGDGKVLDMYRPKYFGDMDGIKYESSYYGIAPVFLVLSDLSQMDHDFVASQPDVFAFPANEKEAINAPSLKAFLATNRIPCDHLDATWTHEEVREKIGETFAMAQILEGLHAVHKREPMSLDTPFSDLAPIIKNLMTLNPTEGQSVESMLTQVSTKWAKGAETK